MQRARPAPRLRLLCAAPSPIGLTAADLFAGGKVSRADSQVRQPGIFPYACRPAVTSALDATAQAHHHPAAVWWGVPAPSACMPIAISPAGTVIARICALMAFTRVEQVRPAHTRYATAVVVAGEGGSAQLRLCALGREGSAAASWPSRLMPDAEIPVRLGQIAALAKAACRSSSQGPMKEALEARLAARPQTSRPMAQRLHRQQGLRQPRSPPLR